MICERNPTSAVPLLMACAVVAACKVTEPDYTGKSCETGECGAGYRCDDLSKKCVRVSDAGEACPPQELPPSCDLRYLDDNKNCCVAGRDCQGGACVSGACQPVTIVPKNDTVVAAIRVTGDLVLWATGCESAIRKCAKDGSGNIELPKGMNCTPTLDVKGDSVYWIEWNGPFLNAVRINGSETTSRIVAEVPWNGSDGGAEAEYRRLAVDDHNAYWAMSRPASVWYAPVDGKAIPGAPSPRPTPLASVADAGVIAQESAVSPFGVAVDSTHVYWSDPDANTIKRRALATLGADQLAEVVVINEAGPLDIALDEQRLYWLTREGLVRSCPKVAACKPDTLASSQANPAFLVLDDQYVYWTTYVMGGTVSRVRKQGGRQEVGVLAKNPGRRPYGIAQDCRTIYWTNRDGDDTGEVMKVAK